MFETIQMAPADPILGLTGAFQADTNSKKVNLGVGVYKDGQGKTPVFQSVHKAEGLMLKAGKTKSYLPIGGGPEYAAAVQDLLFGAEHEIVQSKRAVTVHTPGGTAGLRVAGEFVHKMFPQASIWVSDPTWANHAQVFQHAGMEVKTYPYFDKGTNGLAFDAVMNALKQVPKGDVVLLHGCCHNPTGIDPTQDQWEQIADVAQGGGWLPLVDFAYQGLGDGLEEDAVGLMALSRPGAELLVTSSFEKLWPLQRTGGRIDDCDGFGGSYGAGSESGADLYSGKLFESTGPRSGYCDHGVEGCGVAGRVGGRGEGDAGPDSRDAPFVCRYPGTERGS